MISVFNGRSRSLGGGQNDIYVQMSVQMREHLHLFKGSSLVVFLAIALHADQNGYAFPKVPLLCKETGCNKDTVADALKRLRAMKINGHRVLCSVQKIGKFNRFEGNGYLIFPSDDEAAQYDAQKAAREENHIGARRGMAKSTSDAPHPKISDTVFSDTAFSDTVEADTAFSDAKYKHLEADPSETISMEKQTAASAPATTDTSAAEPVAAAFLNKNDEVAELTALVVAMRVGIDEPNAQSIVAEAFRSDCEKSPAADRVRRACAWFPTSTQRTSADNVGKVFRSAVRGDWAKEAATEADARKSEAHQNQVARRYVTAPATQQQSNKRVKEVRAEVADLAARMVMQAPPRPVTPAPPELVKPAPDKTCVVDTEAIWEALSECAKERVHKEAIARAVDGAPCMAEPIAAVPLDADAKTKGGAARLVLATRCEILRERAASPIVVNGRDFYDAADASDFQRDLDFN